MDLQKLSNLMASLPHHSGVYLMKDREEEIIYVGKAKDLKKRVTSYLKAEGIKTTALLERVEGLDYILTANEKEALILESTLIKKHRPRYNVVLRDDKQYPCLRLGLEEPYPRLQVVRRIKKDKSPSTSALSLQPEKCGPRLIISNGSSLFDNAGKKNFPGGPVLAYIFKPEDVPALVMEK